MCLFHEKKAKNRMYLVKMMILIQLCTLRYIRYFNSPGVVLYVGSLRAWKRLRVQFFHKITPVYYILSTSSVFHSWHILLFVQLQLKLSFGKSKNFQVTITLFCESFTLFCSYFHSTAWNYRAILSKCDIYPQYFQLVRWNFRFMMWFWAPIIFCGTNALVSLWLSCHFNNGILSI